MMLTSLSLNSLSWRRLRQAPREVSVLPPQGVVLMVDMCGRGWEESLSESHCVARAAWPRGGGLASWAMPGPMQLGGLAHELPPAKEFGWSEAPTTHPLDGCVSHLAVNGQVSGHAWK